MWSLLFWLFAALVAGLVMGWPTLFWLLAAFVVAVSLAVFVSSIGRRRMRRYLHAIPGITFDELWCGPDGLHAIATSSVQGQIGVFTRQGRDIRHRLFDEANLRRVELLESGALAQRRGELAHVLRLTFASEAEPVLVTFWDGTASETNDAWRQASTAAADWTQHLTEIMARVAHTPDVAQTKQPAPSLAPATRHPTRAKTPQSPRVPTVRPGR